ncbi:hypothetical protein CJ030_MR1G003961 [Morella rubra]|uniref:Chlororespiratory reduction 42 n=1 Tax=Morella rubra TaxID=262757 RepID=A0A6A1WNV0_9ROSI|nr:hypothetical protein CJ030_MR1G003961 [Morella rubra]
MASSLSSTATIPCSKLCSSSTSQFNRPSIWSRCPSVVTVKCESNDDPQPETGMPARSSKLEIGSPVIVIEAPKMMKTATSIPCLRVNSGLVKPGDVGRIVSRKPKDVWAVRLTIGTYLIDGKYFKPLELDE